MRKTLITLSAAALLATPIAQAQNRPIKIIEPQAPSESAKSAAIDSEHFEFGVSAGILSVEDFNSNLMLNLSFSYYFSPNVYAYLLYGTSDTERSNAEESLGADFNPDRTFGIVSAGAAYKILEGRSFWGKSRKYNSGVFVLGGVEQVDFAGESETGFMFGLSHRTVITDYLALNIDFKDHIVSRTFVGEDKMTQNVEFSIGLSSFF